MNAVYEYVASMAAFFLSFLIKNALFRVKFERASTLHYEVTKQKIKLVRKVAKRKEEIHDTIVRVTSKNLL